MLYSIAKSSPTAIAQRQNTPLPFRLLSIGRAMFLAAAVTVVTNGVAFHTCPASAATWQEREDPDVEARQQQIKVIEERLLEAIREIDPMIPGGYGGPWQHLTDALSSFGEFERAEEHLKTEAERLNQLADDTPDETYVVEKRVFLRRLRSISLLRWAQSVRASGEMTADEEGQYLDLLKRSYEADSTHAEPLKLIVRLAFRGDEHAGNAAEYYASKVDYEKTQQEILYELSTHMIEREQYEAAREVLEVTRRRFPDNPLVLNNLAWTYLSMEEPDFESSLSTINEAVDILDNSEDLPNRDQLRSHFLDTRGLALEKLERWDEAATSYRKALEARSDNAKIVERLIYCMERVDQPDEERLNELREMLKQLETDR